MTAFSGVAGLVASPSIRIRRTRRLPVSGEILVRTGDRVDAEETVARAALSGRLHPVDATIRLGIAPGELQGAVRVREGETVKRGQVVAETRGWFGLGGEVVMAPCDGTVVSVSPITGQIMLAEKESSLTLSAYLSGQVVSADPSGTVEIEAVVSMVQGIFGVGGECYGRLTFVLRWPETEEDLDAVSGERVVLFSREPLTHHALIRMRAAGVIAVVAGSIPGGELMRFAGRTLNPACTGEEGIVPAIVITEGFGRLPPSEHVFSLLRQMEGAFVSVNAVTQVRAGVIRPEIIGPALEVSARASDAGASFAAGDTVRVVRGHHIGALVRIQSAPSAPQPVGSGAVALVYEVELPSLERLRIPRANVEPVSNGEDTRPVQE